MMTAELTIVNSSCMETRIIHNVDYTTFILDGKWLKIKYKEYGFDKILMLKTENVEEFVITKEEECE